MRVKTLTKAYIKIIMQVYFQVLMILSHQYMSRMEHHHPKPNEFIPERWLADKDDPLYYGNTNPFVTAPFGFGVRMCIGKYYIDQYCINLQQLQYPTFF